MSDTGLVWIREDFRLENNAALSYATQNHQNVIAFFIYNNNDYDNQRDCLLYTSPSPRDQRGSRMPSSA